MVQPAPLLSLAGFSHLPSGLYPSYLHLNHLEAPSSGSPLLSQLGQPSIFDTQKGQEAGVGTVGVWGWGGTSEGFLGYPLTPSLSIPGSTHPRRLAGHPHSLLEPSSGCPLRPSNS